MPIYEYRCRSCGHSFSRFFRTLCEAEAGSPPCPACGKANVRRLLSQVAVHVGAIRSEAAQEESKPQPQKQVFGRKELEQIVKER
ncbi:MAG TPA: zinc ribbon domain-containing protein, partial [Anaerolineae bacterium]|nr:zinc ribbon domain-containing protein [Anaerolineae bacterium]